MRAIIDELGDNPVVIDDGPDDGDGEDGVTSVHVSIYNPDGTWRSASANVPDEITADQLAVLIRDAALGAAAAHGTDTWIALQQLLAPTEPRSST